VFKPQFSITHRTANALTDIERARGFLEAATLSSQWLAKMQNQILVREAHYTTHIEGTQLTLTQSRQIWEGQQVEKANPDDIKELLNYRQAFDLVAHYIGVGDPITEGLIREIHKRLVKGVRGDAAAPGEYRKIQNYVVNSKSKEVIYTPPSAYELPLLMQELINWINHEKIIHAVLLAGIAQFQLVHIHPFLDGNGRTARLLSTLCLYKNGYDFKKLFTISEYYDRDRTSYYQAIQSVRQNDMNMTAWLEYFSEGLATQLQEIKTIGKQEIEQDIVAKQHHLSDRQKSAIEYLFQHGEMTIQAFQAMYPNITRRTLQRDLRGLVDKQLVIISGSTNNLLYKLRK